MRITLSKANRRLFYVWLTSLVVGSQLLLAFYSCAPTSQWLRILLAVTASVALIVYQITFVMLMHVVIRKVLRKR